MRVMVFAHWIMACKTWDGLFYIPDCSSTMASEHESALQHLDGLSGTPCTACQPQKALKWWCRVKIANPCNSQRGMAALLIGNNQIILSNITCSAKACSRWTHCSRWILHLLQVLLAKAVGREKHCKEWSAWCSVREPQDCWDMLHALEPQKWQPHHGKYLQGTLLVLPHLFCLATSDFPSAPDRLFKIWWSLGRASILSVAPYFRFSRHFFYAQIQTENDRFSVLKLRAKGLWRKKEKNPKNQQTTEVKSVLVFPFPFPGGNYPSPRTNEAPACDVQLAHRTLNKIL